MLIFEKAQVTKHYVQFAFLFVHTVRFKAIHHLQYRETCTFYPDPSFYVFILGAFTTYINVILGPGGKASKNTLKDINFIFLMANVRILGVFRTHAL